MVGAVFMDNELATTSLLCSTYDRRNAAHFTIFSSCFIRPLRGRVCPALVALPWHDIVMMSEKIVFPGHYDMCDQYVIPQNIPIRQAFVVSILKRCSLHIFSIR